jgi:hypothetical protein
MRELQIFCYSKILVNPNFHIILLIEADHLGTWRKIAKLLIQHPKTLQSLDDEPDSFLRFDSRLLEERALQFFNKVAKVGEGGADLPLEGVGAVIDGD